MPPLVVGIGLMLPFYVLMAGLVIYPMIKLVVTASSPPGFTANFHAFLASDYNRAALRTTFVDSLLVTAVVLGLGAIVAWSLRTTARRWVRLILVATITAPLLMNSILKAFAFTVLLETNGLVNRVLIDVGIIQAPLSLLYTQFAVILGMVYYMFPFAALPLYVASLTVDLELVSTAESLGASRRRSLLNVALPLALPGIVATAIIDYVLCLGFFLMPLLLGGVRVPFTANAVWQDVTDFFDLTDAAMSSLVLLVAAVIVIVIGYLGVGRERLTRAMA